MKIKAFAFDMDGTLLLSDGSGIHPENMKALKEANAAGYKIILATGRPVCMTKPSAEEIGNISHLVCNNGGSLFDMNKNENISKSFLTYDLFEKVVELGKETKSFFAMSTTENIYRLNFYDESSTPEWVKTSFNESNDSNTFEAIKNAAKNEKITQLTIKNSKELIKAKRDELNPEFSQYASLHIANDVYLDMNPKGVSKLTGLQEVADALGIDIEEIMTFGDSGNDVQMIKGSGYGVAMGNANEEAKAAANEVIGYHDTDAIAKKIREVITNQSK